MYAKRGDRRIGVKTGGAAKARARVGTTRSGLFSKLFKRKAVTESKPVASKPAASKPAASKPAKPTGRAAQMMANSAGNKNKSKTTATKSTPAKEMQSMYSGLSGNKPTQSQIAGNQARASLAQRVKEWKKTKPERNKILNGALGSEIRKKSQAKLDKALAAWKAKDPRN
jgi:hypothetical protein